MSKGKKRGVKKKRGRPNKYGDTDYKELFTTITIQRSTRERLKEFRDQKDASVDDTLRILMDIADKIGTNYLGLKSITAQQIINGIARAERLAKDDKEKMR